MPIRHILLTLFVLTLPGGQARADEQAENAAAQLLEDRMANARPDDLAILRSVSGKEIIVVRGSMDHIEQVLTAAKIEHRLIRPRDVASTDLMADQILMVNCPGNIPAPGIRRIAKFVKAGGLLYTTDWALLNVVQKAFPNTIAYNGRGTGNHLTNVVVHAHENNLMSNMLLRNDSKPQWWLEGGSYPVKILNRQRVQVLASSKQMKKRYGAAPVVVRFAWGDGEAIHVVSHFYRQMRTVGPQIASKSALDKVGGLTAAQKQAYAKSSAGKVSMSEVESSYAFQQMTSNLVVSKNKRNRVLDKTYRHQSRRALTVDGRAVPAGSRLKVIERKGDRAKVRDDRGNEAWVNEDALLAR